MRTQCNQESFEFHPLNRRQVRARFDGGAITSDAGGLLLREVEKRTRIVAQFAACFENHRDPVRIEHTVESLVAQRVYGLALGYEDLNDHDQLRCDPLLAVLVEKPDLTGAQRVRFRDEGEALAGKSTLNRLELTRAKVSAAERYKKIGLDFAAVDRTLVDVFLQAHSAAPNEFILDLDSTDDPLHGEQEGRFFHGYYGRYSYLPLYIFAGEHLFGAGAALEPGRGDGQRRGVVPYRDADSPRLARGENHRARRLGLLPGRTDGLVRSESIGLLAGAGLRGFRLGSPHEPCSSTVPRSMPPWTFQCPHCARPSGGTKHLNQFLALPSRENLLACPVP